MDRSFKFFRERFKRRGKDNRSIIFQDQLSIRWNRLHLTIFEHYFLYLSMTCEFGELPAKLLNKGLWTTQSNSVVSAEITVSFAQELKSIFMVPKPKKFRGSCKKYRIKKYQLVEVFISFLLQLLYHKTDSIVYLCDDRIHNLEKELRFLLTILGDTSFMQRSLEHKKFKKLLSDYEAVANEAGSLLHSIVFSVGKADERIDVVLNKINLLKANIMGRLSFPFQPVRRSAPKTSVVDSLLIVDSLVYDLENLMKREDDRIADVKRNISWFHWRLTRLQSFTQTSEITELKEPLMRIGDLAHEAESLIISFLVGDAPSRYFIRRLDYIEHNINLIVSERQEITEKYKSAGLKFAKYFSAQLSIPAKRNTKVDDVIVGFEDSATYILDKLVGGGTERLQVISIFGMPGLGKTTLAKKLYNHPSVSYRFDKLSWCVVSQTYKMHSILTNILIHMASELDKDRILKMEEESLVELIYRTLKGKRYLVVMDDIWDLHVWNDLRRCFPDDGNGSRILFTTRNKEVAPPNSIIYALPSLTNDQCWELLEKKVFDNNPCPPELLGIGKQIAKNCNRLPLAIVIIAGILSTKDIEKSTWEEVGENLTSYLFYGGDNSVMRILEFSYKHLQKHLKPCFLYFGAFHEDEEIPVRELMKLWIAEGFVHREEGQNVENIAEEYLMELIDKSLVIVAKRRSDGGVKTCVVHDLLREFCLKTCEAENFLKFVKSEYYSIDNKSDRQQVLQHSVTWSYCQYMRSFYGRTVMLPLYVRDMRLLRVLYFDCSSIYLTGIEFLVNLRHLVIADLPPSIVSLVNLEYLHVVSNETVYLSSAIMKMKKLRYIHMVPEAVYDKDCNSNQTSNLEFVSGIIINSLKDEEMLKCSPHLRKLKCSRRDWVDRHFDLSFLAQLKSLNLRFYEPLPLEISLPSNIRKMTLSGCTVSWEKMSIIGRLENLEVLKLCRVGFIGERWDTRDGELEKLRFLRMELVELTEWNVDSSQHFPNLQRLILSYCHNLQEIPSEIGEIATLQLIEVQGFCTKSLLESAKRIQQEQCEDMGNEDLSVILTHASAQGRSAKVGQPSFFG